MIQVQLPQETAILNNGLVTLASTGLAPPTLPKSSSTPNMEALAVKSVMDMGDDVRFGLARKPPASVRMDRIDDMRTSPVVRVHRSDTPGSLSEAIAKSPREEQQAIQVIRIKRGKAKEEMDERKGRRKSERRR